MIIPLKWCITITSLREREYALSFPLPCRLSPSPSPLPLPCVDLCSHLCGCRLLIFGARSRSAARRAIRAHPSNLLMRLHLRLVERWRLLSFICERLPRSGCRCWVQAVRGSVPGRVSAGVLLGCWCWCGSCRRCSDAMQAAPSIVVEVRRWAGNFAPGFDYRRR
jgi:hypothetical protein